MARVVNIHDAKTHLSRLIQEVLEGKEVIIARANVPVARLEPISKPKFRRVLGTAKGLVRMASDFEEPVTDFESYS